MKIYCTVSLWAALLSAHGVVAFAPLRPATRSSPELIKNAGGGIPMEPAGNKNLFDPATDGKLQGTGDCDARISSAYEYLAVSAPTSVPENLDDAQHWLEDIGTPPPVFAKATKPATARVLGRART